MTHWVRILFQDAMLDREDVPHHVGRGLERVARILEGMEPHQFRTDDFEDIADGLSECTDLSDLSRLMWKAATSAGYENFIVFVLKNGANGTLRSRVCTSCNAEWVARYQTKGYQAIDPVMARAAQEDGIFEFADLDGSGPLVAAFWEDAQAHRIGRNGLCIVRTRPDGARLGVSFLTAKTDAQAHRLARLNGADLVMIADICMDAFCYASYGLGGEAEALSPEELRFLYLLATRTDPKEAFEVMPKFGSNKSLQASIRRKLGVETVFQAVSKAAARGDFDDVPYDASEVTHSFPDLKGFDLVTLAEAGDDEAEPEARVPAPDGVIRGE